MTSPLHVARAIRKELGGNRFVDAPYQWGVVHAINGNTVDLYLDGSPNLTPSVRYLASYTPTVGDVVKVDRFRSDRVVVGTQANGSVAPKVRTGYSTVTMSGGSGTITHNAGFTPKVALAVPFLTSIFVGVGVNASSLTSTTFGIVAFNGFASNDFFTGTTLNVFWLVSS